MLYNKLIKMFQLLTVSDYPKGVITMKKTVLALSLMIALLTAVSCSENNSSYDKAAETVTTAAATEAATVSAAGEKTTAEAAEAESALTKGTAFKRGTADGPVYTSEYGGFRLAMSDDYYFVDDEEIEEDEGAGLPEGALCDAKAKSFKACYIPVFFYNVNYSETDLTGASDKECIEAYLKERAAILQKQAEDGSGNQNCVFEAEYNGAVTLGGQEFYSYTMTSYRGLESSYYGKRIDDDFCVIIRAEYTAKDMEKYVKALE